MTGYLCSGTKGLLSSHFPGDSFTWLYPRNLSPYTCPTLYSTFSYRPQAFALAGDASTQYTDILSTELEVLGLLSS